VITLVVDMIQNGQVIKREAQSFEGEGAASLAFWIAAKVLVESERLLDRPENSEALDRALEEYAKGVRSYG